MELAILETENFGPMALRGLPDDQTKYFLKICSADQPSAKNNA